METIQKKLEISRLELLDMGLRGNTLLHFRPGAKTLEVIDEVSSEIYRILVDQQKSMTFLAMPNVLVDEKEKIDDIQPLPDLLEDIYGGDRHTDTRLQTKLSPDDLDKRLLRISTETDTYAQEQGVDILYLALGFLTWFEDKNSDKSRKAPLILVPVSLVRSSAKERFKVSYTQADLGPNLSLSAKMKMEFNVDLPDFDSELDINGYFAEVANRIKNQSRWKVAVDEMALGFFSFGKFQMYQDLDPENWPNDKKPGTHPILAGLLGNGFIEDIEVNGSGDGSMVAGRPKLVDLHFVKDADSSQTDAVMAVKQGSNLVIQGPPGTGKSQTITNIISESLADGKTVLFVAEKMAALEVVKRRLDECHLGDAVFELHSHKSNKKTVLEELKRTLDLGSPAVDDRSLEKRRHIQLTAQLNDYCVQVNQAILNSGVSYIDALGHHLKLTKKVGDQALPIVDFAEIRDWSNGDFINACALVKEMSDHLEQMGTPANCPFAQSALEDFSPFEQNRISTLLDTTRKLLAQVTQEASVLAQHMGLKESETLSEIETICRAAKRAIEAPNLTGIKLTTDDWRQRGEQIKELLNAGARMKELRRRHFTTFTDDAWHADLSAAHRAWMTKGKNRWRFFSRDFRQAKRTFQGLLKGRIPKDSDKCLSLIDDILLYQKYRKSFGQYERLGAQLFGAQWMGERSNWNVLNILTNWIVGLYEQIGRAEMPEGIVRFLEGGVRLSGWDIKLSQLEQGCNDLETNLENTMNRLAVTLINQEARKVDAVRLDTLCETLQDWHCRIDDLYMMTHYNRLKKSLNINGLEAIGKLSFSWNLPPSLLLVSLKASKRVATS